MKNIKEFLKIVGVAVATGVTGFVLMIMFIKHDAFFAIILSSKSVVGLLGLVAGIVIGFIAGTVSAHIRTSKQLSDKDQELSDKDMEIKNLGKDLDEAAQLIILLWNSLQEENKRKLAENHRKMFDLLNRLNAPKASTKRKKKHPQKSSVSENS